MVSGAAGEQVSRDFGVIDHFPYTAIVLTFRAGAAGEQVSRDFGVIDLFPWSVTIGEVWDKGHP